MQRRMPMMMTCREFEEFIADYLDGALPWPQRLIFRMHVLLCRECRAYLRAYARSVALGKKVFDHPDDPVPEEVPEDLVRAILAAQRKHES